jgi:hypothetical protein
MAEATASNGNKGVGCAVIILIVIGAIYYSTHKEKSEAPATTAAPAGQPATTEAPVATLSAFALYQAYEENEVRADAMYKGKWIRVSGTVDSIGKDILDTPYITLEAGQLLMSVQAMFARSDSNLLVSMNKGAHVTVTCKCDGKFGNVSLRNCRF